MMFSRGYDLQVLELELALSDVGNFCMRYIFAFGYHDTFSTALWASR